MIEVCWADRKIVNLQLLFIDQGELVRRFKSLPVPGSPGKANALQDLTQLPQPICPVEFSVLGCRSLIAAAPAGFGIPAVTAQDTHVFHLHLGCFIEGAFDGKDGGGFVFITQFDFLRESVEDEVDQFGIFKECVDNGALAAFGGILIIERAGAEELFAVGFAEADEEFSRGGVFEELERHVLPGCGGARFHHWMLFQEGFQLIEEFTGGFLKRCCVARVFNRLVGHQNKN